MICIVHFIELLQKDPVILLNYQKKFQHILVDEFQDNNFSQLEILKLIGKHGNITAVGDDDQCIMKFQGAYSGIFEDFKSSYTCNTVELSQNYRSNQNIVKLANPISADLEILKPSLLPTMLGTIHFNQNQGSTNLALFEIGTIYKKSNTYKSGKNISEYTERQQLLITLIGKSEIKKWFQRERNYDLFDVKGIIESLCYKFLFEKCNFISSDKTELTLNNLNIHFNSELIGKLGLLHKKYLLDFGIEEEVFYAEINLEGFVKVAEQCKKQFKPIHRFPGIRRDIALITPKSLLYRDLTEIIEKNKDEKLEHHEIFDLYSSKEIGNNLKSIAISLYYQSSERTLTDEEVDKNVHKIIQKFEINKNIIVRRKLD